MIEIFTRLGLALLLSLGLALLLAWGWDRSDPMPLEQQRLIDASTLTVPLR